MAEENPDPNKKAKPLTYAGNDPCPGHSKPLIW
jgi:hypothetical protein